MAVRNTIQIRRGYSMGYSGPLIGNTTNNSVQTEGNIWTGGIVLAEGEIGYEINSGRFKIGRKNISTGELINWENLDYAGGGSGFVFSSGVGYYPNPTGDDTLYSILTNTDTNITVTEKQLSELITDAIGTYYEVGLADNLININNITISGNLSASDGTFSGDIVSNNLNLTSIVNRLRPPQPPTLNGVSLNWSDTPDLQTKKLCHGFSPSLNSNSTVVLTAGQNLPVDFDNDYITSIVSNVGPGESGTILTVIKNTASVGTKTLTNNNDVGTYSDLIITEDKDYSTVNSAVASGFWQVHSVRAAGTSSTGWNTVKITSVPGGETSTLSWYYDNFNTAPALTNGVVATGVGTLLYSSSVPHYNGNFNISFNAQYLSGDTYTDAFISAVNNSAGLVNFGPLTRTNVGILENLTRNFASTAVSVSIGEINAKANTFNQIAPNDFMNNITVSNSYTTSTIKPVPTNTVLLKTVTTANANFLQEDNIPVGSITQLGSSYTTYGSRLSGYGTTDNPTGTPAAWNSSSSLGQYDAAVVAGILSHNLTNYSTGYTPAGPNLSSAPRGSGSAQYFTFKATRNSVSRLIIKIGSGANGIAGLWFRLPGSDMDTYLSSTNGWASADAQYNSTTGFTSSFTGCAEAAVVPLNSQLSSSTNYIITFGTNSSTNSNDEIHVRVKLSVGQTITALSLQGI